MSSPKPLKTILECIGHTPLVQIDRFSKALGLAPGTLFAKVEYLNPGGSVKDRIALNIVNHAETSGTLKPGGTLIEATSGNTGLALAMLAAVKGYKCIFVMPDKMSQEKVDLLKAYGAKVVLTRSDVTKGHPEYYTTVAERIQKETPNSIMPGQFVNMDNPQAHFETTGPEIWESMEGRLSAFVGGIGTGGTITGTGRYLKQKDPKIQIVVGDPVGSVISMTESERQKQQNSGKVPVWLVEGIGQDYLPKTYDANIPDHFYQVNDTQAFYYAKLMAVREGILVGGSSGTALCAAVEFAKAHPKIHSKILRIVVLLPDSGRSYLSKMYNETWLKNQKIDMSSLSR